MTNTLDTLTVADVERQKLQRHFGRFDTYLWTELIPVLCFIVIGVLFWWMGRGTRAQAAAADSATTSPPS